MSKKYSLNREDGKKILKGAGIAVSGAFLAYLSSVLTEVDFGAYTAIAVAVGGVVINAGVRFLSDYSK